MLDSCRALEQEGFDVTYLPVQKSGLVDLKELEAAVRPDTVCVLLSTSVLFSLQPQSLVSVMGVNNEIGVVQPLADIGALCRSKGVSCVLFCLASFFLSNFSFLSVTCAHI